MRENRINYKSDVVTVYAPPNLKIVNITMTKKVQKIPSSINDVALLYIINTYVNILR